MQVLKGRPKYDQIFDQVLNAHEGTEVTSIGVFCCGPMGKQLRAACNKKSKAVLDDDGNPVSAHMFSISAYTCAPVVNLHVATR